MIFRKRDGKARRSGRRLLAALVKDRSGATMIEFAMLAIPFSLLVFAILESCISFAAQQLLVNATDDIAREIRTGQLRPADIPNADALKTKICERLEIIVGTDCAEVLKVDLRDFDSFEDAAAVHIKLTADDKIDTTGFGYEPGGPRTINMLRAFYAWPVITDFLRGAMSNLDGGKTLLFATATWQNEPFDE